MGDEARRPAPGLSASNEAAPVQEGKTNRPRRSWQHPLKRQIKVPYRVAAAVAVMEMGVSDYSEIAEAVGLTVEEVERIDMAEDLTVRQLAVAGIPAGQFFRLDSRLRCPKCQAKLSIAPCLACYRF